MGSAKGRPVQKWPRTRSWWFPSAWWCKSGVTATPLRSGRWLLMQCYESGWVSTSRTTRPLRGNAVQVRSLLNVEVFRMLQNKPPRGGGGDGVAVAEDGDFMGLYPTLWKFLTTLQWDDGSPRQPATVSIFMQAGRWTACLTEKNWDLILFATAERLEGLWEALDGRLADPAADWRVNRRGPGDKAKRVQRPS